MVKPTRINSWIIGPLATIFAISVFVLANGAIDTERIPLSVISGPFARFNLNVSLFICLCLIFINLNSIPKRLSLSIIDIGLIIYGAYTVIHINFIYDKKLDAEYIAGSLVVGLFLLSKFIFDQRERKKVLVIITYLFMCFGIYECFIGLCQLLGIYSSNNYRFLMTGNFHNPGIQGVFLGELLLVSSLTVFYIFRYKLNALKLKCLGLINAISSLVLLIYTESRTAFVSVSIGLIYCLFCFLKIEKKFLSKVSKKYIWSIVAFSFVLFSYFLLFIYGIKKDSSDGRVLIWRVSYSIILDSPLVGHGYKSFRNLYGNYQAEFFKQSKSPRDVYLADNVVVPFNEYINVIIEFGLIGLALFLVPYVISLLPLTMSFSDSNEENMIVDVSLRSVLIFCSFCALTSYPFSSLMTMISVYLILLCISFYQPILFSVLIPRPAFIAGSVVLIFGSLVIFFYTIQQNRVHRVVFASYEHFKQGDYTAVIKDMQTLRSSIEGDEQALLMYGKSLAMNNRHLEAIGVYNSAESVSSNNFLYINKGESHQKIGEFAMAERAYFHAWNIVPNRLYPQYKLAKLYVESNDTTKAKIWAQRVVSHVDKVPSFSVNMMKKEMRMYLDSLNASKHVM